VDGGEPGIELGIPARAEYVALARLVVSSIASSRRDLADERIDDLKVAVSEACTNAIEAHRKASSLMAVTVACSETDDRFVVSVRDHGGGFNPETLPEHPPVTDPERLNFERGLGIPLIRTLVDDVEIDSSGDGTEVRLVMSCGRADMLDDDDDAFDTDFEIPDGAQEAAP
jgi:serine/threonine-protein kinase RsbW